MEKADKKHSIQIETIEAQLEELLSSEVWPGKEELEKIRDSLYSAYRELDRLSYNFNRLLSLHPDSKVQRLRTEWVNRRLTQLMHRLRAEGYSLRKKNEQLASAVEAQAYRLMELVRSGRKSEAFYLLERTYLAHATPMPRQLFEAFLPIYSVDEMKLLVFSYISGVASSKEKQEESQSDGE